MSPMLPETIPDARQIRAARAFLGWSQTDLADRAFVGISTVADFERGARTTEHGTILAMAYALRLAGIEFIHGGVIPDPEISATP